MSSSKKTNRYLIFTDLDGTLLNRNYSSQGALSVLKKLKKKKIPVVFCTAKTKSEQELIRKELGINDPFIVENGSAIYIPKNYFGERKGKLKGKYEIIVLGVESKKIKDEIDKLKKKYKIKSYHNMSAKEVSKKTGLTLEAAKKAKRREFGETIIESDKAALRELKKKFNVVIGGRFMQVFGEGTDKGKSVKILSNLYRESSDIITMGIGNSFNDKPMLKAVDKAAIVRNPDGNYTNLGLKNIYKAKGIGPRGWKEVVEKFVLNRKP